MVAKPKRAPLPKKIKRRCRKKARSKVQTKDDTKVHDYHHMEEVLALLQAWKDNVPVSDINRREIRCGSDCSGLGCDLVALDKLGMSKFCKPVFWCENDAVKQGIYKTVSKHLGVPVSHMYPDIVERNNDTAEDCDLYISGFPCPSFSALGKRLGTQDSRGQVGYNCLMYVIRKRPCVVIFENVRGLLHVKHKPFLDCMKKVLNECHYRTWLKVLGTKQLGIPHSRPRVYIVAIQQSKVLGKFKWPKPVPFHKSMLGEIIDKHIRGNEVLQIPHYENKYGKEGGLDLALHFRCGFVSEISIGPEGVRSLFDIHTLEACHPRVLPSSFAPPPQHAGGGSFARFARRPHESLAGSPCAARCGCSFGRWHVNQCAVQGPDSSVHRRGHL